MRTGFLLLLLSAVAACGGDGDRRGGGGDASVPSDSGGGADSAMPGDSGMEGEGGAASCGTTCEDCFACDATVAACRPAMEACAAEPECAAYRACVGERDDAMTVASCMTDHPAGATAFCAYWGCLTYDQCDAVCEDAIICPR